MEIPKELSLPVKKALFRLSKGDLTSQEMLSYLSDSRRKNTGFPEEIAARTVALLEEHGFLDDKRLFLLYLKKLDEKGFGPFRLRRELEKRGFPASYVRAALERNIHYPRRAVKILLAKRGALEDAKTPAGRKRLVDFLVRYGYDYATARSALEYVSEEDPFLPLD